MILGGVTGPTHTNPPVQAYFPTPATMATLLGKAVASTVPMLALALHALWVHPYVPAQAWKAGVRAALLVLAAASSVVVAWARALDLRLLSGSWASDALTAGSYAVIVLFAVVISVLVGSVARAMMQGVREENARIKAMKALPARQARTRRAVPRGDSDAGPTDERTAVQITHCVVVGGEDAARGATSAMSDFAFAVHAVRRPKGGSSSGATRRHRRRQRPHSFSDPALAAAAAVLPDATFSDADVAAACENVVASLDRLPADDLLAASATLLPGLSLRLSATLSDGGSALDSTAISAMCQAMASLSDYADSITLSRLASSGVSTLLVALLRQSLPLDDVEQAETAPPPPVLAHGLWLLEDAALSFTSHGGAALLMALLIRASSLSAPARATPSRPLNVCTAARQWADASLQVCVAVASVAVHANAAAALLDAGAIHALSRMICHRGSGMCTAASDSSSVDALVSSVDAEAACRALANVLRPVSSGLGRPGDVTRVCNDLAASGAVAGCITAVAHAGSEMGPAGSHLLDFDGLLFHSVELLFFAFSCALTEAEATALADSDLHTGDATKVCNDLTHAVLPGASAILHQASAVDTTIRAVQALLVSTDGPPASPTPSVAPAETALLNPVPTPAQTSSCATLLTELESLVRSLKPKAAA